MTEQRFQLAEKLRTYISKYGINDFNEEHLQKVGLTLEELKENFTDRKDIVKAILEHERRCFEEIFNEYNFEQPFFQCISFVHHYVIESFPGYFRRTYANAFGFYL